MAQKSYESPLHHRAIKQKAVMGIWRVTGSTRLQNLAVRSILASPANMYGNVFLCAPITGHDPPVPVVLI
eukprot:1154614-Pelagomonas_calceolata.AAC.3